jgi:Flp pilus assembly protein TadB
VLPSPISSPPENRARLAAFSGWSQGVEDPHEAEVATAYGRWADRLYLNLACLFVCVAVADLMTWAVNRSLASLLGPAALLILCLAYLNKRRRFRQSVRRD